MSTNLPDLHDRIIRAFGPSLRSISAVVAWNHLQAPALGESTFPHVGKDRCGLFRWMGIDNDLLTARSKLKNIDIQLCKNKNSGGKHIEIVGGDIKLLINHDRDPSVGVPKSEYGKSLAESNPLFAFAEEIKEADYYVAVLFHSRCWQVGFLPQNLEIRFPDDDEYACEHLRLFDLYADLKSESWISEHVIDILSISTSKVEKIARPDKHLRQKRRADSA